MDATNKIYCFQQWMRDELKANETKGNWEEFQDFDAIVSELEYHKAKFFMAFKEGKPEQMKEYLADCANIIMFLANACHLFDVEEAKLLIND